MSHSSLSFTALDFPITESPDNQVRAGKLCFQAKNKIYTLYDRGCADNREFILRLIVELYIILKYYSSYVINV